MSRWSRLLAILLLFGVAAPVCGGAHAQNQTPTTSPVLDGNTLPYKLRLRLLGPVADLPTLQSFVAGTYGGGRRTVLGWIFGGIASPGALPSETFASNRVFEVVLQAQDGTE